MPYPPRPQFAGAVYHITTRATGPSAFFRMRSDRLLLLHLLARAVEKYEWRVHAYCLMVTHYHLFLTTPKPNLALGMQFLNSVYARRYNEDHGRLGHFVAARYSSSLVESDGHALEVTRYIPLNPVRSELCERPEGYIWSSYGATIGRRPEPAFLASKWMLELFDDDLSTARQKLKDFVDAALVSETVGTSAAQPAGAPARRAAR
jgi:putative transposase